MNFYGIMGQVSAKSAWFLKNIGFKNIASFEKGTGNIFSIHMKNGLTAQIKYNNPGERGVYWSVKDFESEARDRYFLHSDNFPKARSWKDIYNEKLFESALTQMMYHHDASVGINWVSVDYYLDKVCLKPLDKIYISLSTNDDRKITEFFIVDVELLKILKKLKYNGGFLRFNISVIKDNVGGELNIEELNAWLAKNVDRNMLIL